MHAVRLAMIFFRNGLKVSDLKRTCGMSFRHKVFYRFSKAASPITSAHWEENSAFIGNKRWGNCG